jgi:mRNA interferase ChpB
MAVFDRGDIVGVPLDPAMGHEPKGTRPALVLTIKAFNRLGDVLVAPIIRGAISRGTLASP